MPSKAQTIEDKIPPTTALFIGAFSGVLAWWVIYRCCPKPPVLDKFLEWWFSGRHGPREQPATAAPIPDGGDDADATMENDGIELQDITARRPTSSIGAVHGSEASTPETDMSVTTEDAEELDALGDISV